MCATVAQESRLVSQFLKKGARRQVWLLQRYGNTTFSSVNARFIYWLRKLHRKDPRADVSVRKERQKERGEPAHCVSLMLIRSFLFCIPDAEEIFRRNRYFPWNQLIRSASDETCAHVVSLVSVYDQEDQEIRRFAIPKTREANIFSCDLPLRG